MPRYPLRAATGPCRKQLFCDARHILPTSPVLSIMGRNKVRVMIGIPRLFATAGGQASRSTNQLAGLVTAATVMIASAAAADPITVALVESLTSKSSNVEALDYLKVGQVIQLGPQDTLVLSYRTSCARERITGGTVIIGIDSSEVRLGSVVRVRGACGVKRNTLTGPPRRSLYR